MKTAFLALALTISLATVSPADSCESCTSARLCNPHKERESAVLAEARAALRSRDEKERIAALERVAELTEEHADAPSRSVAKFLAASIRDDSLAVRRAAVLLLAKGQEPGEALKGLLAALDDAREATNDASADRDAAAAYVRDTVGAVARMRDDRSVRALSSFLAGLGTDTRYSMGPWVCEALLVLGSRDALETVIDYLAEVEKWRKGESIHEMLARFAERQELEGAPSYDAAVAQAWKDWLKRHPKSIPARLGKV